LKKDRKRLEENSSICLSLFSFENLFTFSPLASLELLSCFSRIQQESLLCPLKFSTQKSSVTHSPFSKWSWWC
jgi:hypothetical protein